MSAFTEPTFVWEPVTPRGVAVFARASLERLVVVQCVVAIIATAAIVWLLSDNIFPVVDAAVNELPTQGEIRAGRLLWTEESPLMLAEGKILAFSVDLEHGGVLRSPADFQFEFGKDSIRIFSLFGEGELFYPPNFPANRLDLRPKWGAWSPEILALVALGTFFGLLLTWAALASVYCLPVWLICFFTNRDLTLMASWRLAGAALMPGALLLSASLVAYGLSLCDLVQLCFAFGMHFVIGWVYLFVSPLFLNRALTADKNNPFLK